jgi:uncharacterized sulfatase
MGGALAGACVPRVKGDDSSGRRPNVVVILADDLGYGDVSGFGLAKSPFQTPSLERMAAEGALLTSFYAPTPYCAPSRASLLTGRYPFRNGVVFNPAPDAGINEVGLPAPEVTIAEHLKSAGYATCCIGKWHLGHTPQFLPRTQGFDEYFGILYSNDMRPVQLVEDDRVVEYPVVQATLTKRYTQRALSFVERSCRDNRPFFLYLAHAMPHKPLAASEDFYTPETPDDLYADVIRELDWSVGQVLSRIRQLGIAGDTMVLFLSDNGPWYGGSTGGLRGMKALTWEGGLRVPMIAWWPGRIPAGRTSDAVAGTIDVLPTILKAVGLTSPDERKIDGRDLWPLLTTPDAESPHQALFGMQGPNLATVRSGRWRLHVRSPGNRPERGDDWVDPRGPDGVTILAPYEQARPSAYPGSTSGDASKSMMLFDIVSDPAEQKDVSGEHPEVVSRLKGLFDQAAAEVPAFNRPRQFNGLRRLRGGALTYEE